MILAAVIVARACRRGRTIPRWVKSDGSRPDILLERSRQTCGHGRRGAGIVWGMLLERDAELKRLGALVVDQGEMAGKVVLIRGEAGIGKSALVDRFIDIHGDHAHVLHGTCDDLFIPQPLAPFWDMARDEPAFREPIDSGNRPRLLDAVMDLLSRAEKPTILVIEDTHWADEATLDAVRFLGRRMARTNALLILTYRDGEVDYEHPLRAVIGDLPVQDLVHIQLDGLSLAAVATVVADAGLDPAEVLAATGGNPLLVNEMSSSPDGASSTLKDSLLARLQRLSIGSQEALKMLSVIPEPITRQDALGLMSVEEARLDECATRGFLDANADRVKFRHELIRLEVKAMMAEGERLAKYRAVLEHLPEKTHPCLLIHCAAEVRDVDRLLDLAPRSARYAAAAGSHIQAAEDFRELGPYLDRVSSDDLGPLLDEWSREEFLVDDVDEAIRLNGLAREHYRELGRRGSESRALARAAHYHENAGRRKMAEVLAKEAVDVLGADPDSADLAAALEVNAYLQMMAGNVAAVLDLVDRTLEAGGPEIDEGILVRSLVHRGIMVNIVDYPEGRASLDEARERAESAGQWYEASRAPFLHAGAAAEAFDLAIASDYAQRSLVVAERHELPNLEAYSTALIARIAELEGDWDRAADLVREVLGGTAITEMVALPILGGIETRRGRPAAQGLLEQAWQMASSAGELQRLAPAAVAVAEHAWVAGGSIVSVDKLGDVMDAGIHHGFSWSSGKIAFWLWRLGRLQAPPDGIAEPFRLMVLGDASAAASMWQARSAPYEQALALMIGQPAQKLAALEMLETLGAIAVAARLRKELRSEGISAPRGRGQETRRHAAGLTARQAEVLQLLDEDLSNTQIADRLFVSPRTVENHVSAVLDKLDVATREDAVSRARHEGLLGVAAQI